MNSIGSLLRHLISSNVTSVKRWLENPLNVKVQNVVFSIVLLVIRHHKIEVVLNVHQLNLAK